MEATQDRRLKFFRTAGLLAVLLALLLPTTASAANSIYWSREDGTNSIRVGPLGGDTVNSGDEASTLFDDTSRPCGVALNPAAAKIYWANWDSGDIMVGPLGGSSVGPATTLFDDPGSSACGVAVDPAKNKIYWANFSTSEIRVRNLDGTGPASILFTDPPGSGPSGVAIHPAAGKIYWTNQLSDQVRVGNLDGSGSASTLFGSDAIVPSAEDNPIGVAVNPAAGKIYWTDLAAGAVRFGPLGGSSVGAASTLFNSSTPSGPAIDPTANKIYWGQAGLLGIQAGNLDGSGTASTLFSGEGLSLFTAVLKTPVSNPDISGGAKVGKELTCLTNFAPDLLGAFLYRAPVPGTVAYEWRKGNTVVGVASTLTPTSSGDYTCTVTATNQAGTTAQTSAVKKVKAR